MRTILISLVAAIMASTSAFASGPVVWTVNTRDAVLKGEAKNVSIDSTGSISIAPKLTEIYRTEQSYAWSMAMDGSGVTYIGTGADGRVYRVDAAGQGKLFADLGELNVSAMAETFSSPKSANSLP